jgi:hypothetical protein
VPKAIARVTLTLIRQLVPYDFAAIIIVPERLYRLPSIDLPDPTLTTAYICLIPIELLSRVSSISVPLYQVADK